MTQRLAASLLALSLASAPLAQAAEFTLFIYESPDALALRGGDGEATKAYWQAYSDFGARLAQAGIMRGGAALKPDRRLQADGRLLGGYFVIDVASTEDAQKWAALAPAQGQGGFALAMASTASPAMAAPAATSHP